MGHRISSYRKRPRVWRKVISNAAGCNVMGVRCSLTINVGIVVSKNLGLGVNGANHEGSCQVHHRGMTLRPVNTLQK